MWSRDMGRVANLFVICAGRTGVGMKVATLPRRGTDDRFLSSVARPALDPLPRTTDHIRRWSVPLPEGTLGRLSRVRPAANRSKLIFLLLAFPLLAAPLWAQTDPAEKIAPELKKMIDVFATVEQESADPVSLDA